MHPAGDPGETLRSGRLLGSARLCLEAGILPPPAPRTPTCHSSPVPSSSPPPPCPAQSTPLSWRGLKPPRQTKRSRSSLATWSPLPAEPFTQAFLSPQKGASLSLQRGLSLPLCRPRRAHFPKSLNSTVLCVACLRPQTAADVCQGLRCAAGAQAQPCPSASTSLLRYTLNHLTFLDTLGSPSLCLLPGITPLHLLFPHSPSLHPCVPPQVTSPLDWVSLRAGPPGGLR